MNNILPLLLVLIMYKGCAPSFQLVPSDPASLVAQADSLLADRPDDVDLQVSVKTTHVASKHNRYHVLASIRRECLYFIDLAKYKEK